MSELGDYTLIRKFTQFKALSSGDKNIEIGYKYKIHFLLQKKIFSNLKVLHTFSAQAMGK